MHQLLSQTLADVLAPWGQAAAIILAIFLFVNILVGLVFAIVFAFLFAWVREKAELIKKLRPTVDAVNQAIVAPENIEVTDSTDATGANQQRLVQAVRRVRNMEIPQKFEQMQHRVQSASARVDQQADRVAETMIEIRARTVMVKGMLKAFFLPGLVNRDRIASRPQPPLLGGTGEGVGQDVPAIKPAAAPIVEKQLVEAGHESLR